MLNMHDFWGALAGRARPESGLMPRADRRRWQSARTLGDLAGLTALWLEGEIGSQPGRQPGGPGEETAALVPVLAALCRAGYMTAASQPARAGGGGGLEQRGAVRGFAGPGLALRIADAALAAGLHVIAVPPGRRPRSGESLAVTRRDGALVTMFGPMPAGGVTSLASGWGLCHPEAVAALLGAWQVAVVDPEWGRPGLLWTSLAAAAGVTPIKIRELT